MICTLLLLAAIGQGPGARAEGPPQPQKTAATRSPAAKANVDWEVPLSGTPRRELQAFACGAQQGFLVATDESLSAYSGKDGSRAWIREDLNAAGLQHGPPSEGSWGCWSGWAGMAEDGSSYLEIFSLLDGSTLSSIPLDVPAVGPPTASPGPDGERPCWYLPVEGDRVLVFDSAGKLLSSPSLPAQIRGPLITLGKRVLASTGSEGRIAVVGENQEARRRPTGIVALATTSAGEILFAAGGSNLTAWRCRENRHGHLRCRKRWKQTLGAEAQAAPLVVGNTVIVASRDSFLHAFASKNGHLRWRSSTQSRLSHAPILWDDLIVTPATESAEIFFHRIEDGSVAGSIRGARLESFPVGAIRLGDYLLLPVLTSPRGTASLRAYRISRPQPTAPAAASEKSADSKEP